MAHASTHAARKPPGPILQFSYLVPKLTKQVVKSGTVNAGRRRSSVAQVEDVVSKIIEAEGGFLLSESEKDLKYVAKEEPNEEYKEKRRLVIKNFVLSELIRS